MNACHFSCTTTSYHDRKVIPKFIAAHKHLILTYCCPKEWEIWSMFNAENAYFLILDFLNTTSRHAHPSRGFWTLLKASRVSATCLYYYSISKEASSWYNIRGNYAKKLSKRELFYNINHNSFTTKCYRGIALGQFSTNLFIFLVYR